MWALGDYPALTAELIADLGEALVQACRVGPGERVLDVAAAVRARPHARPGEYTIADVMEVISVGRATVYRTLERTASVLDALVRDRMPASTRYAWWRLSG